jgi:predicted glycosyltransferase
MKLLFFLSHPAHYHLFKNVINSLIGKYKVKVIIVTKDVLEDLVVKENWDYVNLIPEGRRVKGLPILLSTIIGMFKTEYRLSKILRREKINILIGTEGTLPHVGMIFRIPSLILNEDDTSVTPENYIIYPFATKILVPTTVDPEMWGDKRIEYQGYHELAYLHPKYFEPNIEVVKKFNPDLKKYFIIRLALLTASHDIGKKGINQEILKELLKYLSNHGSVYITSERPLEEEFEKYRLPISVHDIHHALYFADLYIGDSQTMSMEAAILGTPSIRFNSFAKQCSVILELEHKYGLVFSFLPEEGKNMFDKVKELIQMKNSNSIFIEKRKEMLSEKVDVVDRIIREIENTIK